MPYNQRSTRVYPHFILSVLLIVYLSLTLWIAFRLPAFVGANENLHYEYVALLRKSGTLPDPLESTRADERHQPPLYYLIANLIGFSVEDPVLDDELAGNAHFLSTRVGNLHPKIDATPTTVPLLYLSRIGSILFGLIGLIGIYLCARITFSVDISNLILATVAFHPTYLFMSATVNNDLAATAMTAILLAYSTWLIARPHGWLAFVGWGIFFALAMLTKANTVIMIFSLPITSLLQKRFTDSWLRSILLFLSGWISFLIIWLSWPIYNMTRGLDALGVARSVPIKTLLTLKFDDIGLLGPYIDELWRSFWLDWSLGQVGYTWGWLYTASAIIVIVSLTGWSIRGTTKRTLFYAGLHGSLILLLLVLFLGVKLLMIRDIGFLVPEGRWLLPALPSLMWLVVGGAVRWWPSRLSNNLVCLAPWIICSGSILFSAYHLNILYPQAKVFGDQIQLPESVQLTELMYNQEIELVGVEAGSMVEGQSMPIKLYWKPYQIPAGNYAVSLQLLMATESGWEKLDWQNSFPGGGLNPT